ncbi:MAG: 4-hydroxythreonine-4-phosphate dehydrogenase PdxA [bacterium]
MGSLNFKTIAITIGDINGIGPEVIIKALQVWQAPANVRTVVIAPRNVWRFWQNHLQIEFPAPQVASLSDWSESTPVVLFDPWQERVLVDFGSWTAQSGKIAGEALLCSTRWAREGAIHAIVTAPVSKAALNAAGYPYPGQTEFIAEELGVKSFAMMLIAGDFRVALATTHLPLRKVAVSLDVEKLVATLHVVHRELQVRFCIPRPRLAVTGVNPHAGEGGLLGEEENVTIAPAIARARAEGIEASGPFSADALFGKLAQRQRASASAANDFDAYFAMYHDQGLIPLKMAGFGRAVNYTAGLPLVRTSPDHGTAFDIAGKNLAQPTSMIEALQLAASLSVKNL